MIVKEFEIKSFCFYEGLIYNKLIIWMVIGGSVLGLLYFLFCLQYCGCGRCSCCFVGCLYVEIVFFLVYRFGYCC